MPQFEQCDGYAPRSTSPVLTDSVVMTTNRIDLDSLRFDAAGLLPAVVQQHDTKEVLMVAWMNREAVSRTLAGPHAWFFSRSRNELWEKGATSGNVQHVKAVYVDCDADTLLVLVDQTGVACHTGTRSCFTRDIGAGDAL